MASFDIAFEWLMDSEDPERRFDIVPDAPVGARAIGGINSYSFPTAFERIAALPQAARRVGVYNFYLNYFWNAGQFNRLTSDEVAKRVFDAAVNMGSHTAVKILQRSLQLEADGIWGPETTEWANRTSPALLNLAIRANRNAEYDAIVKARPEDAKYLKGWLARCER